MKGSDGWVQSVGGVGGTTVTRTLPLKNLLRSARFAAVVLDDRYYMRRETPSFWAWTASPTLVLIAINLAIYLLQSVLFTYSRSAQYFVETYLTLSGKGLQTGFVWQLMTFQFLHANFLHFFLNAFALFIFGKPTEMTVGKERFLEIYFSAGVMGGLLQAVLGMISPGMFGSHIVGASAGVCGVLAAFCLLYRDATIRLFFVIPIRAYHLLIGMLVFTAVMVPSGSQVAHASHLGGMLSALAYFRWILRRERRLFNWRPYASIQRTRQRRERRTSSRLRLRSAPRQEVTPGEYISREVDPILEKISAQGIQSLTPAERKILEAARSRMEKR